MDFKVLLSFLMLQSLDVLGMKYGGVVAVFNRKHSTIGC